MKVGTDGFLFVDKPAGPSSFAVVSAVRRAFKVKRAGHGGTLDPAASGLLIVALGSATRLLPYVPLDPKGYSFGIRFGEQTDTLDAVGTVIQTNGSRPTAADLLAVLPSFCGTILQVPPDYSAVKIDGVRAYHLARSGRTPDLKARSITVHSLNLVNYDEPAGVAELTVTCSGGTYVRSLARDIAAALSTCGYAGFIRRTALGPFHVDAAVPLGECDPVRSPVIPSGKVLSGLPRIEVGDGQKALIYTGQNLPFDGAALAGEPAGTMLAVDGENNIIAVLEPGKPGQFHPVRVFPAMRSDSLPVRS